MVKEISILIPSGISYELADKEEQKIVEKKQYEKAANVTVIAQDALNSNVPFISETIYKKYDNILKLCRLQLIVFSHRWNVSYNTHNREGGLLKTEDYLRTNTINNEFDDLNNLIREYLSTLDVI